MQIKIEGVEYSFPDSVMDVTLQDRIDFDNEHGIELRKQLKTICEMKKGADQDVEFVVHHCEVAKQSLSFYGKIPHHIIEQIAIEDVFIVYEQLLKDYSHEINFESDSVPLINNFRWQNQAWEIQPPELLQDSSMQFGEFIDAKQCYQDLLQDDDQKFKALLSLCCIYFRKKGEAYKTEFTKEGGERWNLLKNLPLHYAIQVGFFLKAYVDTYRIISRYSGLHDQKAQADMLTAT